MRATRRLGSKAETFDALVVDAIHQRAEPDVENDLGKWTAEPFDLDAGRINVLNQWRDKAFASGVGTQAAIAAINQTAYYLPPAALRDKLAGDSALFAEIIRKADIKFD